MSLLADALLSMPPEGVEELFVRLAGAGIYNSGEYNLQVTTFNSVAGVTLGVRYRSIDLDGRSAGSVDLHTPNTDRSAKTSITRLPTGWVYGASVFVVAGAPLAAQTYVVLDLVRGEGAAAVVVQTLAAGSVSVGNKLVWPGSAVQGSTEGNGAVRAIAGSTPAAGANVSEVVPTGARWQLLSFRARFITSAAVANRVPQLVVDDGTNIFASSAQAPVQTASNTQTYTFINGHGSTLAGGASETVVPFHPGLWLAAGFRIRTVTANIDAADTWLSVFYSVREWLEV